MRHLGLIFFVLSISSCTNRSDVYDRAIPFKNPQTIREATLKFRCSKDIKALEKDFQKRQKSFDEDLVRKESDFCHLDYQATLPGFQAHSINDPVRSLHFDLDTIGFVSQVDKKTGRTMDLLRVLVPTISKYSDVNFQFSVNSKFSDQRILDSLQYFFPKNKSERISIKKRIGHSNSDLADEIWPQDYILSGVYEGRNIALSSFQILMGRPENHGKYDIFLKSLDPNDFFNSNLSFDGGDIHILTHPSDPAKKIMFYGSSTRDYWGEVLSQKEFEWMMKKELGVDEFYNWGGVTQHIDMFVNFLPSQKIALVAKYLGKNQKLGCESLLEAMKSSSLSSELIKEPAYQKHCIRNEKVTKKNEKDFFVFLDKVISSPFLKHEDEDAFRVHSVSVFGHKCNFNQNCIFEEVKKVMSNADHVKDFLSKYQSLASFKNFYVYFEWLQSRHIIRDALVNIAKVQLDEPSAEFIERQKKIQVVEEDLKHLGYNILYVPALSDVSDYLGISYTNFLEVDDHLFLPTMNLGKPEKEFLESLKKKLHEKSVQVTFIPMRASLIKNGGVHCRTGILRKVKTNTSKKGSSKE